MTDSETAVSDHPPGWQHSELLDRRSLFGAIALLAAAAAFFLLPLFVDGQAEYATAGPDGRFAVDEFASIQIADGWGIDSQNELFTIIVNGGASAVLTPTVESDETSSEYAQVLVDGLNESGIWIVDPIQEFTTDAGVTGSSYVAKGTDSVAANWILVDGGRILIFSGTASETAFIDGFHDFEQMAKSIRFESTSGASQ